MKKQITILLLSIFLLVACNAREETQPFVEPINTPVSTPLLTATVTTSTPSPTATATIEPSPTPTLTPTPTATQMPTRTPMATATRFVSSDPLAAQLEEEGYITEPIYRWERNPSSGATYFSNQGQFGRMNTGGPDFDKPVSLDALTTQLPSGKTYTYVQYMTPEFSTCELLFFASTDDGDNKLIGNVDIATLNDRIYGVVASLQENPGFPPLCLPYGWHDVNNNGKPDMPVTIVWGNNYTGGELHIFEINDDETIVDLTADLPGSVYHWEFLPTESSLLVTNLAWAGHDCLYPSSPFGFWIYDWDGENYVDITPEISLSGYQSFLEDWLEPGRPFYPEGDIGPLVSLLLTYDYGGQRDVGWQKFLEFTDIQNWPDTDQVALDLLQDDVAHFTREYEAGIAFTPNDASCMP